MKILNELVDLANKANAAGQGTPEMVKFRVVANPDNILAIAESFRALEQENSKLRQERAGLAKEANDFEAELAELAKQKPVCFIHPRMLDYVSDGSRTCGRVWGNSVDEISNEDRFPLFTRPAPAASLTELVPDEMPTSHIYHGGNGAFNAGKESGWNACRAAMLRNIEEAQ